MGRTIASIIGGGLIAWAAVVTILNFGLRAAIPGYHAAEATLQFTPAMKAGRLIEAAIASLAAGAAARWIAPASKWAPWIRALIVLAMFLPVHVQLWDKFPAWYHLTFLLRSCRWSCWERRSASSPRVGSPPSRRSTGRAARSSEPDHMPRVVGEVLAGAGMGEDREAVAVERHPLREVAELVARHRQLAAAARVRSDRTHMEMTDGNAELRLRRGAERLRALELVLVEIDVRVEIANRGFGHARGLTRFARAFPAGRTSRRPA